ncbi:hypothetical protein FB451DRAFT_1408873 [Mycena latifolia]|nr:hypothetical protein FB451DRAFT_1408873 [Mycena latifolia]
MPCQRLPPELWSRIIAAAAVCLHPRSVWEPKSWDLATLHDLKSFSLVAQALLFPAQSLLFHDIELIFLWSDSRHERELSRCRRLSDTLKTSPHLAAHIRRLSVTADCEILSLISGIRLSRLLILRLSGPEDGGVDESVVPLVQAVIGESIRHVQLTGFPRLSYATLVGLLVNSRLLEGLHFFQCATLETEPSELQPAPTSARTKITHLSIVHSGSIGNFLICPQFPLDFTDLIYAEIVGSANPIVTAVLEPARETLQSLIFLAEDLTAVTLPWSMDTPDDFEAIQPTRFPAVTRLGIMLSLPMDLPATLTIFSGIAKQNAIHEVHYMVLEPHAGDIYSVLQNDTWMSAFDAGITSLPLPALTRVEITFVHREDIDPQTRIVVLDDRLLLPLRIELEFDICAFARMRIGSLPVSNSVYPSWVVVVIDPS